MKTIGLIGGMSWESTALYYRLVNEEVKARMGGLHSARVVLFSVDFAEIEAMQAAGDWDAAADVLVDAARKVEGAGAHVIVLCSNTMHRVASQIVAAATVPFLHIADAAADAVREAGIDTVGLLGTRFTMEEPFYRRRLEAKGIGVLVPEAEGRRLVDRVIYEELCLGIIREQSRRSYLQVAGELETSGAGGILLGCTEIGMLLRESDTSLPLFDSTRIHAVKAVDMALAAPAGDG